MTGRKTLEIRVDNLESNEVIKLLEEHLADMHATSPPESVHAFDLAALKRPGITFWTGWDAGQLMGCAALKELDSKHAEIKSMRTSSAVRNRGVASTLLTHIIEVAAERGYERLSLETGSMDFFKPARTLYEKFGFTYCEPFAEYEPDPNSKFMTRTIRYDCTKPWSPPRIKTQGYSR